MMLHSCHSMVVFKAINLVPHHLPTQGAKVYQQETCGWFQGIQSTAKLPNFEGKQLFILLAKRFMLSLLVVFRERKKGEVCCFVFGGFSSLQSLCGRFWEGNLL